MTDALWQLGGWTMVHFLWLGTGVALVGATLRFACRRAAPDVRYAASLLTLATLALLPIGIAAALVSNFDALQPRALPGGRLTVEREPSPTPGQSPGLQTAAPPVIDLAVTPVKPAPSRPIEHVVSAPASPSLYGRGGNTVATLVAKLPWLWLIGAPLTFALLASGLVGSERLRRKCTALTDGPAAAACEQLRQAMRITRRVSVAVCDKIAQPVLIGILRPLILLPASALSGWTPAELEMVLVHELAHVRRWDNLVNLLQRIIESALFFHPAVWLVSRQVRRDREECCDAVVVSRIERPHDYAALLVSIAAKMQSRRPAALAAASAMADHPLAGRVRRILKLEDEPMWISRRTLGLTLALPLLLIAAVIYSGAAADENPPPSKGGARGGIEVTDPTPTAEAPAKDPTRAIDADDARTKGFIDMRVELPRLTTEIARLEALIAGEKKTLADIEIFTQLSRHSPQGSAALEKAIAATLETDPKIAEYHQNLSTLQEAIQQRQETTRNPNDSQLKPLVAQYQQAGQQFQQYRMAVKKAAREQLKSTMSEDELHPERAEHRIRYEAATANLKKYQEELSEAKRKLAEWTLAIRERDDADANASATGAGGELPPLRAEIKRLEDQIAKANEDLVNIEVFRQLALNKARSPAAIEKAVAAFIEKDPTITDLQQKLFELQKATQGHTEESKNLSDAQLKQLAEQTQKIAARLVRDRSAAEKAAREQIAKMPNEAYRAAIVEHKIRYESAMANLKKYQEELSEANRKLAEGTLAVQNNDGKNAAEDGATTTVTYTIRPDAIKYMQPYVQANHKQLGLWGYEWAGDYRWIRITANRQNQSRFRDTIAKEGWLERIESSDSTAPAAFPSLEDQKIADRAYKLLGIDFEPIDADDLAMVKQLGYTGGLRVQGYSRQTEFRVGDIFVGLYVWPTTDFKALDAILVRDDLDELAPLKFRLVRRKPEGTDQLPTGEPEVLTGRIEVNRDALNAREFESQMTAAAEQHAQLDAAGKELSAAAVSEQRSVLKAPQVANKSPDAAEAIYLYDGKPFDEWRSLWKHELNTERRTEAIEALAAFARAGYGKEAAETILDVAAEYDFKSYGESPEGKLRERVAQVLTLGRASRVPAIDWLPALMDRLAKDPDKWRPLMARLMSGGVPESDYTLDPATRKLLLQMASDPKQGPNAAALTALYYRSPTGKGDPAVAPLIKAALAGEDVANALAVLKTLSFGSIDDWPEQLDFLFHQDAAARRTARTILRGAFPQSRQTVAERLEAVLDDPKRAEDHADAIRALGVLARPLNNQFAGRREGWPDGATIKELNKRFEQITREGPPELVAPALVAMGIDGVETIDDAIKNGMSGESEEYQERIKQARDKIEAEVEQLVDPPNFGQGGGGLGGGGGGGIF